MLTLVRDSEGEGQLETVGSFAGLYRMADRLHAWPAHFVSLNNQSPTH